MLIFYFLFFNPFNYIMALMVNSGLLSVLEAVGCTLRFWLHKMSTGIIILFPGLENNHILKSCSGNFPTYTIYIRVLGDIEMWIKGGVIKFHFYQKPML